MRSLIKPIDYLIAHTENNTNTSRNRLLVFKKQNNDDIICAPPQQNKYILKCNKHKHPEH